ncbi:hypothetical protein [Nocardia seriolae]|uniref:Uncharacterized protein n=1 Tax=Nocardia seriolae TaxID=37332 RepID=A0ABC9YVC0_9NOCA|nr:hypothetical protein [Nocardia seriolae]APA95958.1 hypothetical protein NS506_01890 [Nocardia seriolae]PSK29850.1 hypothetical protein C6575_18975 [Nocardia seriolae]QOW33393.1 hypothetical protein IMZ23_37435 [Nocardia seriolae]QUN20860.1 hypothetical protein KEC46_17395 [Nocardia seriolae]WNJ60389.1 hypothetical protein RMO66_06315 [Nocardia seriolae]
MTAALGARTGDAPAGTAPGRTVFNAVIAGLLIVDAVITLGLEVLFLPLYAGHAHLPEPTPLLAAGPLASTMTAGAIPLPFTALAAAVINVLLVMGMGVVTQRIPMMAAPILVWAIGFLFCAGFSPSGYALLMGDWPTMLLLICGLLPSGMYLYYRATVRLATVGA